MSDPAPVVAPPATGPAKPIRSPWANVLIAVAAAGVLGAGAYGMLAMSVGWHIALAPVFGVFLLSFALLKATLASEGIARWRAFRAGRGPDPRLWHGAPGLFWGWVAYKYTAAVFAAFAGISAFTWAADKLNAMLH